MTLSAFDNTSRFSSQKIMGKVRVAMDNVHHLKYSAFDSFKSQNRAHSSLKYTDRRIPRVASGRKRAMATMAIWLRTDSASRTFQ